VRQGWCEGCYGRWRRAGKPEGWPYAPEPKPQGGSGWPKEAQKASIKARHERSIDRCEDAVWLLEMGASMKEATKRAHVSYASLRRYIASITF
jgi:hypothetical protein